MNKQKYISPAFFIRHSSFNIRHLITPPVFRFIARCSAYLSFGEKSFQNISAFLIRSVMGLHCGAFLLHILLPLLLGSAIYLFCRAGQENIFTWVPVLQDIAFKIHNMPSWIKYNLPDGLWLYALLSALTLIWKNSSGYFHMWLLLTIILSYLTEIFQALHFIPGTFDWKDLLAYSIATIIYIFNFHNFNQPLLLTFKTKKNEN